MTVPLEPIDFDHLQKQTMGDRGLAVEVMQIFLEQMQLQMAHLSCKQPDLRSRAHSIKGSARGIGAWSLAEQAEIVELADTDTDTEIENKLETLRIEIKVACEVAAGFVAQG